MRTLLSLRSARPRFPRVHRSPRPLARARALAALLALAAAPALAQTTGFQLSSDQPVQIQADSLDVRDAEGKAVFDGNVEVVQGDLSLRASTMTVFYNRDAEKEGSPAGGLGSAGNIRRIEADGGVSVRSGQQVATGDRGSFDMASEVITLSGNEVVLTDAGNVITGCRLTIAMSTGNAQVEPCNSGRVKLLLEGN